MSAGDVPGWRRRAVLGLLSALPVLSWLAPRAAARPRPRPPVDKTADEAADSEAVFEAGVFEPGVFR